MPKIVDHEQQRLKLSSTVVAALAELGMENTSLRTVAMRHGCTKGMVQHYFADKEELLLAALSSIEEQREARLSDLGVNSEGLALLHSRLAVQLPTTPIVTDEWKVRFAFATRANLSREIGDRLSQSHSRHQRIGISCLRRAQKIGELKMGLNLRNSYRSLVALLHGISLSVISNAESPVAAVQRQMLKTAIENLRR